MAGIVAEHGRLDLAANVAGTSGVYAEVADSTTEGWRQTMAVNLDGVYFCLRAELRAMRAAGGGSIVNVASSAGRMGVPGLAAYSASKHGVIGLTKSAALEEARRGIRVNAVLPGSVRTPMLARVRRRRGHPREDGPAGADGPPGRAGRDRRGGLWLLSDASGFVTGNCLAPDGGVAAV